MKKFVAPAFSVLPVAMKENIASSQGDTTMNVCPLNVDGYSVDKQECQKCKLYYAQFNGLPYGINITDGGIETFCTNNHIPFTSKEEALASVAGKPCPAGL